MNDVINVRVATPSYKNSVSVWYMNFAIDCVKNKKLNVTFDILIGDSLITRVRNKLFSNYANNYKQNDWQRLVFIDDDIFIPSKSVEKLIDYDCDVIGVAVPLRSTDRSRGIECAVVGVYEQVKEKLYKTKYLGTGVIMITNNVVESIVKYCIDNDMYYYEDGFIIYDVFRVGCSNGFYKSEDWYLCDMLRAIGYEIFVDSSDVCIHTEDDRYFMRESIEIDPRALKGLPRDSLPMGMQNDFWTPNDWAADTTKL